MENLKDNKYFVYEKGSEQIFIRKISDWKYYSVGYSLEWKDGKISVGRMNFRQRKDLFENGFLSAKSEMEKTLINTYRHNGYENIKDITALYIIDFHNSQ